MSPNVSLLSREAVDALSEAQAPCISLYQPTHRQHPENQQDPIRFRNLLRSATQSLRQAHPAADVSQWLKPLEALAADVSFWNHTLDGLAVFVARDRLQVLKLQHAVPELAIVADSFHTNPLQRLLQDATRYQVLALTRESVRLFEGDRDALDEIDLAPEVPRTLVDALGSELTEPRLTVTSYGNAGPGSTHMLRGAGGRKDEIDLDTERFFRAVDRSVIERHSRPSGLPLILAALAEHHAVFRSVSRNAQLADEGVAIDPASVTVDELRTLAWQVFEPVHQARVEELGGEFRESVAKDLGGDELPAVAEAAATGRVRTLLLEADRRVPGRLDADTGTIRPGQADDPAVDDLLDDLGELVRSRGGDVWVLPPEQMPTDRGVAAIYRYAGKQPGGTRP
jgi:hypothetical protein